MSNRLNRFAVSRALATSCLALVGIGAIVVAVELLGNDEAVRGANHEDLAIDAPRTWPSLRAAYIAARQSDASSEGRFAFTEVHDGAASAVAGGVSIRLDGNRAELAAERNVGTLAATSVRCDEQAFALPPGAVRVRENRAEIARSAGGLRVREWYLSGPLGIEQGFDVDALDAIDAIDATDAIHAACADTLALRIDVGGFEAVAVDGAIRLRGRRPADGRSLRYTDLVAIDAKGRELPARLELDEGAILVAVDVHEASWPIAIDPLMSVERILSPDDLPPTNPAAGDLFGASVAVSGTTVVVGAYGDDVGAHDEQGTAYVFVWTGSGWLAQTKLVAEDGGAFDFFGSSVAIDGDTVVVGAYGSDPAGLVDRGAAYVFFRTGTTWAPQGKLVSAEGLGSDRLGTTVAVDGDTAIVAAYQDDVGGNTDQGAAYVFVRGDSIWSEQARLVAADGAMDDQFGTSVDISGETAIVGAAFDDVGSPSPKVDQGSAYVFVRSNGTWSPQTTLNASDGSAGDEFGWSVSLDGDTAVIGAPRDDATTPIAIADHGSVYVFARTSSTWNTGVRHVASVLATNDWFGSSVAVSGDTFLVGVDRDVVGSNPNPGAVYAFVKSGPTWSEQEIFTASNGANGDHYGSTVALDVSLAAVGASSKSSNAGRAYVLDLVRAVGHGCARDDECEDMHCVDGVCCSVACGGSAVDCMGCSNALTGMPDGTCAMLTGTACADGNGCTAGDTCSAGSCVPGSDPCFSSTNCSAQSAETYACSACPAGTASMDGTGVTACVPCASETYSLMGAMTCTPWASCGPGTRVATPGSATSNRICAPCAAGRFSTGTNDATCLPFQTCGDGAYEQIAGTPSSDVVCASCSTCPSGKTVATACTATSDTVCKSSGGCGCSAAGSRTDSAPLRMSIALAALLAIVRRLRRKAPAA